MTRYFQFVAFIAAAAMTTSAHADNIIDEHIKAVGGADKIANVKTIHRSGNVSLTGPFGAFEGTITEAYGPADGKGHRVMDLAIFVIESAWSGDKGWQDGPPQGLGDMSAEELAVAKLSATASLVATFKKELGAEAFGEPTDETFNDKECSKVEVKAKDRELSLYINKENKLLEGIGVGDQLTMTFDDYKAVDGVQFAGKVTTKVAQPDITIVNEYTEIKLNGELDESVFAKPEPVDADPVGAEE